MIGLIGVPIVIQKRQDIRHWLCLLGHTVVLIHTERFGSVDMGPVGLLKIQGNQIPAIVAVTAYRRGQRVEQLLEVESSILLRIGDHESAGLILYKFPALFIQFAGLPKTKNLSEELRRRLSVTFKFLPDLLLKFFEISCVSLKNKRDQTLYWDMHRFHL